LLTRRIAAVEKFLENWIMAGREKAGKVFSGLRAGEAAGAAKKASK
jgi:hypothetical protein